MWDEGGLFVNTAWWDTSKGLVIDLNSHYNVLFYWWMYLSSDLLGVCSMEEHFQSLNIHTLSFWIPIKPFLYSHYKEVWELVLTCSLESAVALSFSPNRATLDVNVTVSGVCRGPYPRSRSFILFTGPECSRDTWRTLIHGCGAVPDCWPWCRAVWERSLSMLLTDTPTEGRTDALHHQCCYSPHPPTPQLSVILQLPSVLPT